MSTQLARAITSMQAPFRRDERGQATAEFATVVLVAIALGMAVLGLMTGNKFDDLLHGIIAKALTVAAGLIG